MRVLISFLTSKRAILEYFNQSCSVQNSKKVRRHHICNEVPVSDGHVGWTVCILLNMAAVNNLNSLTFVDIAKLNVEFFGHCIKLYLQRFVDYEYCLYGLRFWKNETLVFRFLLLQILKILYPS